MTFAVAALCYALSRTEDEELPDDYLFSAGYLGKKTRCKLLLLLSSAYLPNFFSERLTAGLGFP